MIEYKLQLTELLVRSFTAILFLLSGYDKLFKIKLPGVINVFKADAIRTNIPKPLLNIVVVYSSLAEFVGGIFLLLGFCSTYTLFALGFDLFLVCTAFTLMNPIWDMKHVFPRFVLLVALLIMPSEYRFFSIDYLLNFRFT